MKEAAFGPLRRRREGMLWRKIVPERLHRIFALILMLQLIQVFRSYWWPETYHIVYAALAVYGVTELLFTRAWAARLSLQAAGIVVSTLAFTPVQWYGWPERWRDWGEARRFFVLHAGQLHPFVELAAGTLLATHVIAAWASTKGRLISLVLVTVIGLAVVDSFFPLELWRNIAWSVLSGLGWLVVLHLRQLKERHYDSWNALAERPLELLLPAVVVIGVMIALGMMMPRAPVLLEDPYTLWMKAQNKEVSGLGGEGGFLITGSDVSSGSAASSKSGYGRNDSQIGGGFQFDYSPVMEVTTTQRSYWRGETKAVYTGKGWTDRKGAETVPADVGAAEPFPLDPSFGDGTDGYRKVEQTVKMIRKDRVPVLFGAGPISGVQEIAGGGAGGARLYWNPEEWELRFQRPSQVESYTVVSEVRELDENKLRQLPAVPADGKTSIDLSPYLQLPDSLPARVGELAKQVTEGAADDYDRLKKLESYLQTTYPYTNTPDTSKQKSKDIVDAFLFEIKEGYCDYYSTAFVVMARTLGLPARWVKGYATGVNPQDEERARYGAPADPNGAGTYTVRNADAHSWAEVYFEGYGWVPFEPTSGFSIPLPTPQNEPAPVDVPAVATPETEPEAVEPAAADIRTPVAVSAAAAAIVLAAVVLFLNRRRLADSWRQFRHRGTTPNQRIVREMERFVAWMQRRGLKRNRHETLRETFASWSSRFGSLRHDLEGALEQFEAARYSGASGDEEAYERFSQTVERIRKAL